MSAFMSMSAWTENMRTRDVEHSNPQKCSIHLYGFPHCLTLNMVLPDESDFTFAPILIKIIFGLLFNVLRSLLKAALSCVDDKL